VSNIILIIIDFVPIVLLIVAILIEFNLFLNWWFK